MIKSYIWPLGNRISHVLMILLFAASYLSGDEDELLSLHAVFGISLGILIIFRILWGIVGPKYSKFSDFDFSIKNLIVYLSSVFTKTKAHIGHNPASSWAIIAMFIFGLLSIVSGLLAYGVGENHGVFAFLHLAYYEDTEVFEELHELLVNIFLFIIIAHILGSLIEKFARGGDSIKSMVTGYKNTEIAVDTKISLFGKIFQIIWILVAVVSFVYLLGIKDNIFIKSENKAVDYEAMNVDFVNECASCHIAYPPYLLPKKSWSVMMNNLTNHFGDDASLDEKTRLSISTFLQKQASENSTSEVALKIQKSLKNQNQTIIAITKTPFWKAKHKDIDSKVFLSNKVKSRANCQACHIDIEKGLLDSELIDTKNIKAVL